MSKKDDPDKTQNVHQEVIDKYLSGKPDDNKGKHRTDDSQGRHRKK